MQVENQCYSAASRVEICLVTIVRIGTNAKECSLSKPNHELSYF